MSLSERQNEDEATVKIKALCDANLTAYSLDLVEREVLGSRSYTAIFMIAVRNDQFGSDFLSNVFDFIGEECLFDFLNTKKDINDLSFDTMFISAKITN